MVTKNPMFTAWTVKGFQATIINDIWPETLFFSLVALVVTVVSEITTTQHTIKDQMLGVLGIILGLVVSFKTSSAKEKVLEAESYGQPLIFASWNPAHIIWVHVPNDRSAKNKDADDDETSEERPKQSDEQALLKAVIEKNSMINLVEAFSVAVKHALRGEAGIYYQDLYPLISFLPRFASQAPMIDIKTDVLPLWQASHLDDPKNTASTAATLRDMYRTTSNPSDAGEKEAVVDIVRGHTFASNAIEKGKNPRKHHSDPDHVLPVFVCDSDLKPARNPPRTSVYYYIPLLIIFKPVTWIFNYMYRKIRRNKYATARPNSDGFRNVFGRKRKAEIHIQRYGQPFLGCDLVPSR